MKYLIWNLERNAWWKSNKRGYTRKLVEAGKYEKNETLGILKDANKFEIEECAIPEECVKN